MFGWLKSILGWSVSGISDLWNKLVSVVTAVFTWASQQLDALWSELVSIYHDLTYFISAVEQYAIALFVSLEGWVGRTFNSITSWATAWIMRILAYVASAVQWLSNLISEVRNYASAILSYILAWVVRYIWDPLYNYISGAISWIIRFGYFAYVMVTHPDLMVRFLAHYLWSVWLSMIRDYAAPIGAWLTHQMLRLASPVGGVLEDIIAAIIE